MKKLLIINLMMFIYAFSLGQANQTNLPVTVAYRNIWIREL